jgi:hypothetical protein
MRDYKLTLRSSCVAELLVAAGAELEPRFAEVAEGPLASWLEERL